MRTYGLRAGCLLPCHAACINALGRNNGQTNQALSATDRISGGIKLLADNLDTVIPALLTIAAIMAVRYAGGLAADTAATVAKTAADLHAALVIEAVALATASSYSLMLATGPIAKRLPPAYPALRSRRASLRTALAHWIVTLTFMGGPVGAALLGLAAGFLLLQDNIEEANHDGRLR